MSIRTHVVIIQHVGMACHHVTSRHVTPCHIMSCNVIPGHAMSWYVVSPALRPRVRDHTNRRRGGVKYQRQKQNRERNQQMGAMIQICGTLARVVERGLD